MYCKVGSRINRGQLKSGKISRFANDSIAEVEMAENLFNTRLSDEIKISPAAAARLSSLIDDEEGVDGIRFYVSGEGCSGMSYAMTFVEKPNQYDCVLELGGMKMYVDPVALGFLEGVEIDHQTEGLNESFVFKNAFAKTGGSGTCGGCGGVGGNRY
jgi:iron-sulfur cluster assembly accessory protein